VKRKIQGKCPILGEANVTENEKKKSASRKLLLRTTLQETTNIFSATF